MTEQETILLIRLEERLKATQDLLFSSIQRLETKIEQQQEQIEEIRKFSQRWGGAATIIIGIPAFLGAIAVLLKNVITW